MEPRIDFENGLYRAVVVLGTGIPAWLGRWWGSHAAARREARELERKLAGATVLQIRDMADDEARFAFNFDPDTADRERHFHNVAALNGLARVRRRLEAPVNLTGGKVVRFPGGGCAA